MITGDNPLTGSNIGYKCGISVRSKGMVICDFKEGRFVEENFVYRERDDETNNTNVSLDISDGLVDEIIVHE